MSYVFPIILIILIIIFVYLYLSKKISGKTLIILFLLLIILLIIVPAIVGIGFVALFKNMCLNQNCSQIQLPFNLNKVRQNGNNFVYDVNMNFRNK